MITYLGQQLAWSVIPFKNMRPLRLPPSHLQNSIKHQERVSIHSFSISAWIATLARGNTHRALTQSCWLGAQCKHLDSFTLFCFRKEWMTQKYLRGNASSPISFSIGYTVPFFRKGKEIGPFRCSRKQPHHHVNINTSWDSCMSGQDDEHGQPFSTGQAFCFTFGTVILVSYIAFLIQFQCW